MVHFFKNSWLKAGVIRTLEQAGLDIEIARHIANHMDLIGKDSWNLVQDCTKVLDNQCANVYGSFIVLELYKYTTGSCEEIKNISPILNNLSNQLHEAIEYQRVMGHEAEIREAEKRFENLKNFFVKFESEPKTTSDLQEIAQSTTYTTRKPTSSAKFTPSANKKSSKKTIYPETIIALLCIFGFFWLIRTEHTPKSEHYAAVKPLVEAFKNNNKEAISNLILYPLHRERPIPPIKNKNEFIKRFSDIFDDKIIFEIVNSDLEKDWSTVGYRGIMLKNGLLWLNSAGKMIAINYHSDVENIIRKRLIENAKRKLHYSIRQYVQPILEWETDKYHIRIDALEDNQYRYVSWAINKIQSVKPDLVLLNGEITYQGSGGNHFYTFVNGKYQYKCDVNVLGLTDTPGSLQVYKNGKLLFTEAVVKSIEF